jgi:hypothetical protein
LADGFEVRAAGDAGGVFAGEGEEGGEGAADAAGAEDEVVLLSLHVDCEWISCFRSGRGFLYLFQKQTYIPIRISYAQKRMNMFSSHFFCLSVLVFLYSTVDFGEQLFFRHKRIVQLGDGLSQINNLEKSIFPFYDDSLIISQFKEFILILSQFFCTDN